MQEHPQSYPLLHVQADFLRAKGKTDWAFKLAKQAVNCAPSEFVTWAKLTDVNIELRRFNDALLTLNSCPMFTYNERDLHRMPTPSRTHLPVKVFITDSGILSSLDASEQDNEADLALLRLPAPSLRGTFKKAYELLTRLVQQLGWDELLRTRSEVFVMEEEYRQQRQLQDEPAAAPNGVVAAGAGVKANADDDASIRGLRSSTASPTAAPAIHAPVRRPSVQVNGIAETSDDIAPPLPPDSVPPKSPSSPIPEILISQHHEALTPPPEPMPSPSIEQTAFGEAASEHIQATEVDGSDKEAPEAEDAGVSDMSQDAPGVERPALSHSGEVPTVTEEDTAQNAAAAKSSAQTGMNGVDGTHEASQPDEKPAETASFSNKRLCERWLDNLFMVLYEDLRVYTIWRAEIAHFKSQHIPYRKTPTEWEILGDLALRLHHREEAKDAYQRCLEQKFSAKAWMKLLEFYVEEGDVQRSLNAAIRLATYQHRWYMESAVSGVVSMFSVC